MHLPIRISSPSIVFIDLLKPFGLSTFVLIVGATTTEYSDKDPATTKHKG